MPKLRRCRRCGRDETHTLMPEDGMSVICLECREVVASPQPRRERKAKSMCRICGKSPAETDFYRGVEYYCVEHWKEKCTAYRRKHNPSPRIYRPRGPIPKKIQVEIQDEFAAELEAIRRAKMHLNFQEMAKQAVRQYLKERLGCQTTTQKSG